MAKKIISKKIAEKNSTKELVSELPTALEVSPTDISEIKTVCKKIGMGLEDYLKTIQRGLTAKKVTLDKYGEEHEEDDTTAQLKAALLGLEVEGYIRSKTGTTDNSKHTHVTYAWLNSSSTNVGTLRAV